MPPPAVDSPLHPFRVHLDEVLTARGDGQRSSYPGRLKQDWPQHKTVLRSLCLRIFLQISAATLDAPGLNRCVESCPQRCIRHFK